jgi:hypothetical protein
MLINFHNRRFTALSNSESGQVNAETQFHYTQDGNQLRAAYSGGQIRFGQMLGIVHEDNSLEFLYQHIDIEGNLKSGHCTSTPEVLPDGRVRLHEQWQWNFGSKEKGTSVVEEISI